MAGPITGRLGRMALLLSTLWLLPLLLIRAQPYDPSDLRIALSPAVDCPAPCFLGVRPGTRWDDAAAILAQNAWVAGPRNDNAALYASWGWQWNETAPAWINRVGRSLMVLDGVRVNIVVVETTITWGDFLLAFGKPDQYRLVAAHDGLSYDYRHVGWYADRAMLVVANGICWPGTVYDWPVVVQFRVDSPITPSDAAPPMTRCR